MFNRFLKYYSWKAGKTKVVWVILQSPTRPRTYELTLRIHGFYEKAKHELWSIVS